MVGEKITSQTANDSDSDSVIEAHIENRRLFNLAAGRLRLEVWEQEHLHGCRVCQGVVAVLMNQVIGVPSQNPPKSSDAA
jgi:hypothetical protein